MLNLLVTLRAIVYSNREKLHADSLFWIALFSLLFVSTYVLSFTVPVFNTEWNLPNAVFGILPVFAMILVTWSFRANKASVIRRLSLISCPCWLIYNIFSFNIGAIICDSVSLISAVVGIFRYDIKKTADKTGKSPRINRGYFCFSQKCVQNNIYPYTFYQKRAILSTKYRSANCTNLFIAFVHIDNRLTKQTRPDFTLK